MRQSRRDSALEVATSTTIGMIGSFVITYGVVACPYMDTGTKSSVIVGLCTVWSLARGYVLRRHFERR